MNTYSGTGGIEVGKMPQLLYPWRPLYRIVEGARNWSGCFRKEKISCSFQESCARLINVLQKYRHFFMDAPCINDIKHFYCPTSAHNVQKCTVIITYLK